MKKLSYIFMLLSISVFTYAQDEVPEETAKKEKVKREVVASEYLPATGDFAIGVDAMPYINFVGNMFNGTQDQDLGVGATTIYGKYFLSPDAAVRVEVYINNTRNMDMNYVQDDANFASNPNAQVEDKRVTNYFNYAFGVGYQQYRGYGRLRGTYGAVASYFIGKNRTTYEWGNEMTASNMAPTSTNWYGAGSNPTERHLEERLSGSHTISVGAIAGVEYFLAKKLCIGGELGLYYSITSHDQRYYTYQTVEQGVVREYEQATAAKDNYRRLSTTVYDLNNVAGRIYVLFHF